jgi:hypothetical protein
VPVDASQGPDLGALDTEAEDAGSSDGADVPDSQDTADVPDTAELPDTALADVPDVSEPEDIRVEDTSDSLEPVDVPDVEPPPPFWLDLPPGYGQAHFEELIADLDGVTDDFALTLPEGTISFALMLSGAPEGVWMRLNKTVVPPGFPVVKAQGTVTCATCPNRVYASQILNTSLFPNTPDVAYKNKGNYKFGANQFTVTPLGGSITVGAWSGTPLTARVLLKEWTGEEPPDAGTLDLNLFLTGAGEITAETAPDHARVLSMIAAINAAFEPVGISIGEVRYFDTPEGTPTAIETTIDTDSDLALLFGTSIDAPPGINIFFVSSIVKTEIEDQSTGIVLGIAGGIPGPPFTHPGSPHSGVALALDDIAEDSDALGKVAAHELGHYLGLFHTVEKDGTSFDPIEDTAQDDTANLMYWAFTGVSALSPGQQFVMLRHPSVWLSPSIGDPEP